MRWMVCAGWDEEAEKSTRAPRNVRVHTSIISIDKNGHHNKVSLYTEKMFQLESNK